MADGEDTLPPKRRRRQGRQEKSLEGTNLYRDTRTDVLWWRRTDPLTGKRVKLTTGTKILEYALKKAAEFDDDLEKRAAGIKTYDTWTQPLAPLVGQWFDDLRRQDQPPQERWLKQKRKILERALRELSITTAADLTDVGRLDLKLKSLGKGDATLRRRYQDPLKQFSGWLAENGRHLDRDPLGVWKTIQYERQAIHRAFGPDEVAQALIASDWLDVIHHRRHSLRPVFEVLLVTAPRLDALMSRDVVDYLRAEKRIDFGSGRGKKGRGQGKLDAKTAAIVEACLGARTEGPLLLSPRGGRLDKRNVLRWWREAMGLGVVRALWPVDSPWDVNAAHLVNQALLNEGEARVPEFGNPDLVGVETRKRRRSLRERVQALIGAIRPEWTKRMERVTCHSFRHTHQTWAKAAGVDQVLVNLQCGWRASSGDELAGARAMSTTGLTRYLDARSKLLDCRRSAEAVRELLDVALAALAPKPAAAPDGTDARSVG